MRPLPDVHPLRLGLFTSAEAASAGWTPDMLARAVTFGSLRRFRPGIFAPPRDLGVDVHTERRANLHERVVAAALANPCAYASHASAAILHDLPVWSVPELPCLTVPPRYVGDIAGVHLHRTVVVPRHVLTEGVRRFTIERTVVDVGREHGVLAALVVADAALHRHLTTYEALRAAVRRCRGWPGVRAAREAVDLADARAESPLETASRYKLRGLVPAPEPQALIYHVSGRFIARCDFVWDELGVVGEADGMEKYEMGDSLALSKEKARQVELERCGLVVVRWGSDDLRSVPRLVSRIEAGIALAARSSAPRLWRAVSSRRAA